MMRHVYLNLLEEVKGIDPSKFAVSAETEKSEEKDVAGSIKWKYVRLGLIPKETLPNTSPWELVQTCKDRLGKIWRATSTLWNNYNHELLAAFRLQPGTTVTFQIGVALDGPGATIGWERTIA